MNPESIRLVALVITMVTAVLLMIFTAVTWERFQPPVVKALLVCFNAFMFFLVYGFGEAAQQGAPMGARIYLSLSAVIATLAVLLIYKRFDRR